MDRNIGGGWFATDELPKSLDGEIVYTAQKCQHGHDHVHSLQEALVCGLLVQVRQSRHRTQEQVARAMGIPVQTISRWENNRALPHVGSPYARLIEGYLLDQRIAIRFPRSRSPKAEEPAPEAEGTQL